MTEPSRRPPEPEIIPPGAPLPRRADAWSTTGTYRVHMVKVGPLGAALLALGVGAAAVLATIVVLGTALIGLAAVGALVIASVIAGILRGPSRPLR